MGLFDKPIRPVVRLKLMPLEMLVEVAALAGTVINLLLFAYFWPQLPDTASIAHTGMNKSGMFLFVTMLPMMVYLGATLMGMFPRWFNYPVPITEENASREYRLAANMLRFVKAEVVLCMLIVEWVFVNVGMGENMSLSLAFVIVFLGLLAITLLYFIYEMFRQK